MLFGHAGNPTVLELPFRPAVDVPADFSKMQFLAAGSFTAAPWESSETRVGVSLRRRLESDGFLLAEYRPLQALSLLFSMMLWPMISHQTDKANRTSKRHGPSMLLLREGRPRIYGQIRFVLIWPVVSSILELGAGISRGGNKA